MTVVVGGALVASVQAGNAPANGRAVRLAAVQAALTQLGVPYVWGQDSPARGFDASGLVVWAFAKAGLRGLPHDPLALSKRGMRVPRRDLQRGDLVFFDHFGHVGIYIGGNRFIQAPHAGTLVQIQSLSRGFYARHYYGAVRLRA